MKKFIAAIALVLLTACSQTGNQSGMMQCGMMCEKCPCCQKMMEGGMMKDGMQCPMMKDGKPCSCCQKMMEGMDMKKQPKASTLPAHTTHH